MGPMEQTRDLNPSSNTSATTTCTTNTALHCSRNTANSCHRDSRQYTNLSRCSGHQGEHSRRSCSSPTTEGEMDCPRNGRRITGDHRRKCIGSGRRRGGSWGIKLQNWSPFESSVGAIVLFTIIISCLSINHASALELGEYDDK